MVNPPPEDALRFIELQQWSREFYPIVYNVFLNPNKTDPNFIYYFHHIIANFLIPACMNRQPGAQSFARWIFEATSELSTPQRHYLN